MQYEELDSDGPRAEGSQIEPVRGHHWLLWNSPNKGESTFAEQVKSPEQPWKFRLTRQNVMSIPPHG